MPDHFSLVAPFYERVIGTIDPAALREHLNLPTNGRLLDAGGGTGRVAKALQGLAGQIVGDPSAAMLRQTLGSAGLSAVCSQVELLPFADGTFDRIVVVDAFHHFADHRAAVAGLWRVLALGGRLVIEEPNIGRISVKLVALAERIALMQSRFFSPRDMAQMLQAAGAQVHIHSDHRFNSWVVADKAQS